MLSQAYFVSEPGNNVYFVNVFWVIAFSLISKEGGGRQGTVQYSRILAIEIIYYFVITMTVENFTVAFF